MTSHRLYVSKSLYPEKLSINYAESTQENTPRALLTFDVQKTG